jgi:hypothetical protein
LVGVGVGVLEGELGLADPAQPMQGLGLDLDDRGRLPGVQLLMELVEQLGAAGEGRVAGRQVGRQRAAGCGAVQPVQHRWNRRWW